jgi:cytochrome c-type biogenesis protein CcmH/NrfF
MAAAGMSLEAILDVFVEERGEIALSMPPNEGFNRLAWLVPTTGIVCGVGLILGWTRRWSSNVVPISTGANTAQENELLQKLDDELAARG